MSEKLEKARLYEIEEAKNIPQEEKPAFHVSDTGWLDQLIPMDFCFFLKERYIFFTSIILTAVTGALCTGVIV